jgi:hypothetical protein
MWPTTSGGSMGVPGAVIDGQFTTSRFRRTCRAIVEQFASGRVSS